jgi:hypothetical protein
VVLDAYENEVACKRVIAVLNTLASNSERALGADNTDEGKAEEIESTSPHSPSPVSADRRCRSCVPPGHKQDTGSVQNG